MKGVGALLVVVAVATGCGSAGPGDPSPPPSVRVAKTLHLKPGHYTFHLGGRVEVGDKILCVTRDGGPAGGGFVEEPGHGVGSSTGFQLTVSPGGTVRITCPANPGNG